MDMTIIKVISYKYLNIIDSLVKKWTKNEQIKQNDRWADDC